MNSARSSGSTLGYTDWARFAGVILVVNGIFGLVQGLAALLGPDAYFAEVRGELLVFDLSGWGWWTVAIGALVLVTGLALLNGALWARPVAVILAVLGCVVQMILVPVQPWWSFIIIAVNLLVIFCVAGHSRPAK